MASIWAGSAMVATARGGGGGRFGGRGLEGMSGGNGSARGRGIGARVGGMGGGGAGLASVEVACRQAKDPAPSRPGTESRETPALVTGGSPAAFEERFPDVATRPVVQTVGEKTFYWKNNLWRDADLTLEETEKNPTRVEQFSDGYFAAWRLETTAASPSTLPSMARFWFGSMKKTYLIEPPETN